MGDKNFTEELEQIFTYIKENLIKEFPTDKITVEYFMLSVLENDTSIAYKSLSRTMLNESMDVMKEWYYKYLANNTRQITDNYQFDNELKHYIDLSDVEKEKLNLDKINSGLLLCVIFDNNENVAQSFKYVSVTYSQLFKSVKAVINEMTTQTSKNEIPLKHEKKERKNNTALITSTTVKVSKNEYSETEKSLINVNNLALEGKIESIYENKKIYETIFDTFAKRNKNNVIIVGDDGIGKTSTVMNIANKLINYDVPSMFKNRVLMQIDFNSLISGMGIRGIFEAKGKAIIEDARNKNKFIFFIDDIQTILNDKGRFSDVGVDSFIENIINEKNILLIATTTPKGYSNLSHTNSSFKQKFNVIKMDEMTQDECIEAFMCIKNKLENYHNINISRECVETCVKLCKRYMNDRKLPEVIVDMMDEIGASYSIKDYTNDNIEEIEKQLLNCLNDKEKAKLSTDKDSFNEVDKLTIREINLRSKLNVEQKKLMLNREKMNITEDDVKNIVSTKTNIPLTQLSTNEIERLKNIDNILKSQVIGQDEAIDEVCKVIKRQRIGLSNKNKPAVLFFGGSTGTGKTYLAKKIAEKIFGDEKYLIRLDMSEYSDKTSVNKLCGSSPGYVGYEEGGYLTEAIKRNKYCVLLLDEIEKASEEVHNTLLQVFDDGRLTDNKGNTVDFKNVIIIMTSNVGAKEISLRGTPIGFNMSDENNNKDLINKNLKKHFKPEFLNRIDKIVYFNTLTTENIKNIISLEIKKIEDKLNEIGFYLEEDLKNEKIIDLIYGNIKNEKEYGARPIIKEIQRTLEDRITDFIINENPNKGKVFTYDDLF